ncbi:MAG TPA: glycosyl hydrolase family 79 C-terminal domain-containing protein [Solirubrobacteraceae bacterium]|nr:glycosyl hydrolase family 79 C-terminal domain-containing protein [Solirubrobacteraceae bacterium]
MTVGAPLHVRPLADGFMGLSLEYRAIEEYGGRDPSAINRLFVRLIDELSPGERPELRIGGDSTDRAWWPARGVRKPRGAYIRLNAEWGAVARALIRATDARVILGIDLEADSGASARVEAARLVSAIGRHWVQALELGNEPELYSAFTWYHVHGHKMPGRARGWNIAEYLREFSTIARSLPHVPLAGPSIGSPKWMRYVGRFIVAEPRVRIVTLHRYPLQRCYVAPGARIYPTIGHLLTPTSTTGLADSVASAVALAHAHGLGARVDEVNTISCGRVPAVDESFASALWVLQTLFAFARTGADGVNIHTYAGSPYALFKFHRHGGDWSAVTYPEYYGMRMFAQAAPPGSRLLSVAGAQRAKVDAWATRAPQGQVRVVLIDTRSQGRTLAVRIHDGGASATVERLLAPSLRARSGVTIGGQSFTATSTVGIPSGQAEIERVARWRGAYRVRIPGASASLLTIATR